MIAAGDIITVPFDQSFDLPSGRVSGDLTVMSVIEGRAVNLGRDGRLIVSGVPIERVSNAGLSPAGRGRDGRCSEPVSDGSVRGFAGRRVVVFDFMNMLVRSWHVGQPSEIHAVRGMLATVRLTIEALQPSVVAFACEGGHGFRRQLLPTYKSSRTKPDGLQEQIDLGLQALDAIGWPALRADGFEADDVAATIATQRSSAGDEVIVVSTDKDLLQLTTLDGVRVFDPYKTDFVSEEAIRERWSVEPSQIGDLLALAGDKSDEIPGVPGIGPKTAAELLAAHGDLERILEAARLRQTMPKPKYWSLLHTHREDALISRRLVTLQTNAPIPTGWLDWPARNPRVMWFDKLRALGLGASAGKIGDVFGEVRRSETTLIEASGVCGPVAGANHANRKDATSHEHHDAPGDPAETGSISDSPRLLTPDERCESGRTAGQHYQSGKDWRAREPDLARQADAGTISPASLWGDKVGNWARYWWAGATGKPFPTAACIDRTATTTTVQKGLF